MTDKNRLLCPVSSVCRLILLNFKPKGTKISISDYSIKLSEPWAAQGLLRWWFSDGRKDVQILYPTIIRFIELYLCQQNIDKKDQQSKQKKTIVEQDDNMEGLFGAFASSQMNTNTNTITIAQSLEDDTSSYKSDDQISLPNVTDDTKEHFKILSGYLCEGLKCLAKTYGEDNASIALTLYVKLLEEGVNSTYIHKSTGISIRNSFLDQSCIRNLWTPEKIKNITQLFTGCFNAKKSGDELMMKVYENAILTLLDNNDELFRSIIKDSIK